MMYGLCIPSYDTSETGQSAPSGEAVDMFDFFDSRG